MSSLTSTLHASRSESTQPPIRDFVSLTKPRLSLMSVATAILGYFAAGPELRLEVFFSLLTGTALAAFGAAVLNQWWEREADARMQRTADRPVADGRMAPNVALVYGLVLSALGVVLLWAQVGWVPAALTLATVLLYVLAYTPLKRRSTWATEVGAIPGALPPLIGWVAAGGGFSAMGWALFAVLFAWQIPHFMAISWNFRDDYRRGGFAMLSLQDPSGKRVGRRSVLWTVVLIAVSLYPLVHPQVGWFLGVSAVLLGLMLLWPALQFWLGSQRNLAARRLFFASLIYLPFYLGALVADQFFL